MKEVSIEKSVFMIDTIEHLKVVMEPVRLKILENFTLEDELTRKGIAARIGEDPGKMYYHIQELCKVGLLEESKTVMKGNMAEKYYRKLSKVILFSPALSKSLTNLSPVESKRISNAHLLNFIAHLQSNAFDYATLQEQMALSSKSGEPERMKTLTISSIIACSESQMEQFSDELVALCNKYHPDNQPDENHYQVCHLAFRKLDKEK